MSESTNHLSPAQTLADHPVSLQLINAYLVRLLQLKFRQERSIDNPSLRQFLWDPEVSKTNLVVTTRGHFDPRLASHRPALVLKRNTVQLGKPSSIGDRWQTPHNLLGDGHDPNHEATTGQHQQLTFRSGSHTIFCIHGEEAAADALGEEVFEHLLRFRSVIARELGMSRFRPAQLPEASRLKEARPNWAVPVVVEYTYQRGTILRRESPILNRYKVQSSTSLS